MAGANVDYVTVFDASQKWIDWTAPAFGAAFVAVGLHTLVRRRGTPPHDRGAWRPFMEIFVLFGLGIATIIPSIHWRERAGLIAALQDGRTTVVEGRVRDFVPMPWSGHAMECFMVEDSRFCYSDFVVSPGFNNARSHGGPIHEGLQVRIHHVDSVIARLEVATAEEAK